MFTESPPSAHGFRLPPLLLTLLALAACPWVTVPGAGQVPDDDGDTARRAEMHRTTPMAIHRLSGPIELDGVIDEPAWEAVAPFPMTMHEPSFDAPMTERTEIRMAYDDEHLYLAGRLWDSDPSGIRTNTFYRDAFSGDDLLALVVDSYNDHETAVWFVTNPSGARTDRTVSNDAVFGGAGMPMNSDWNAHWDVATSQDDRGWYAEFRIPFSTLGFQVVDDEVTMGVIVYRFIARKNERHTFPAIDPRWGGLAYAKPSQAQRVALRGVEQSAPVYVSPYALGGVRRIPSLHEPVGGNAAWRTESDASREVGVDLRYSPTSNLSLAVTANTDFAQVEADDQQINLTRFPLFFPEKRQFFQERSSTFQFATGGSNGRLFHSRRIGLADGKIVRIWGGARAVGRIGGLDFGLLDMQTAAHDGRPSENMGVLRLQQQVLNPHSSVGAMLTSRIGSEGRDNIAYGLDTRLRPFGDEYVTLKWAQTFDEATAEESVLESGLVQARWDRVRDEGLAYSGEFVRVGRDFVPGLGFQPRRDFRYFGGQVQYKWFRSAASPFRSTAFQVGTDHYIRGADGSAESRSVKPQLSLELKGGTEIRISAESSYESVLEDFAVAGATIPSGDYWFHGAEGRFQLPRSGRFRGHLTAAAGSFYDGTRVGVGVNPSWNPSRYLELGSTYELNRLRFGSRGEAATAHLARLKFRIALNTNVSLDSFAQYSNIAGLGSVNARFRYHFREGTDLWIVWNEGVNTERDVAD